jgi:hypothetical protein
MPLFLRTYPCYFVVNAEGWPDVIRIGDEKAICLFTDLDVAEAYCKAKRNAWRDQGESDVRDFNIIGFEYAEVLLATLHKNATKYTEHGVHHVAIDPTPGKRSVRLALDEFLADLEQSL